MEKQIIFLDTETTGLYAPRDKIVELAIIDYYGNELINMLINPGRDIPQRVVNIHGIDNNMVKNAPTIDDLMPRIKKIFDISEAVVIYNADFDTSFLPQALWNQDEIHCCMKEFIFLYSELEGHFSGKRFPLKKAYNVVTHRKIEELGKTHRALSDCLACRTIWLWCQEKRKIVEDPEWKDKGYEVYCGVCRTETFHKYRLRYRQEYDKYYQCIKCRENNISKFEMDKLLKLKNQD